MNLTDEQKAIIECTGNIKIQAVAGSGKTSTLIELAKSRSQKSRILYLAFNRSVRKEAQTRFQKSGISNVRTETAHSLAYQHIVNGSSYKVRQAYKPYELVKLLNITPINKDSTSAIILASHILKFSSYFCNQSTAKVNELDYLSQIHDEPAISFVKKHYSRVLDGTRRFLAKMNSNEIEISHEFYLKRFQLSKPVLPYDMILFDEGQDASPVMLDVFMRQNHTAKVIVGDIHQQIYSWRYAINALSEVDFKNYMLTTSFRFPQRIADLAMQVLCWKGCFNQADTTAITGIGKTAKVHQKATLARTNLSLIKQAIEFTSSTRTPRKVYFEGNLSSYTYAAEGASIWDVLYLYLDKKDYIRDPSVATMEDFEQLTEFAEMSEDSELLTLIEMVSEYGKDLPYYMKLLKDNHLSDDKRENAAMIFSTVHRCKGLEYDSIKLADDFIDQRAINRFSEKKELSQWEIDKIIEEINLLYVAVTRTKNKIEIPPDLFNAEKEYRSESKNASSTLKYSKNKSFEKPATRKAYAPWTNEAENKLRRMVLEDLPVNQIAAKLKRSPNAILMRMEKLGL